MLSFSELADHVQWREPGRSARSGSCVLVSFLQASFDVADRACDRQYGDSRQWVVQSECSMADALEVAVVSEHVPAKRA